MASDEAELGCDIMNGSLAVIARHFETAKNLVAEQCMAFASVRVRVIFSTLTSVGWDLGLRFAFAKCALSSLFENYTEKLGLSCSCSDVF
jgi:hypothetical protein